MRPVYFGNQQPNYSVSTITSPENRKAVDYIKQSQEATQKTFDWATSPKGKVTMQGMINGNARAIHDLAIAVNKLMNAVIVSRGKFQPYENPNDILFRGLNATSDFYTPRLTRQAQETASQATQVSAKQVQGVMQNLVQGQPGNQTEVNNFLAEQMAELGIAVSKNTVALRQILGSLRPQ